MSGSPVPLRVAYIDLLVLREGAAGMEVLCLRRSALGRSAGSWEAVHGHMDPGETPVATARRELREEAGLEPERLYNLSRVEAFYRHSSGEVVLIPVFAALVPPTVSVRLSDEHDAFEWLPADAAARRMSWPRIGREIEDAVALLGRGGAGPLEDMLRVGPE